MNMMNENIFMDLPPPLQQQKQQQNQMKTIVLKNDPFVKVVQGKNSEHVGLSTFANVTQTGGLFPTLSSSTSTSFTIKQEDDDDEQEQEVSKQVLPQNKNLNEPNQNEVGTIEISSQPSSSSSTNHVSTIKQESSSADLAVKYYKPIKRQRIEERGSYMNELHMLQSIFMKRIDSPTKPISSPYLCDYPKCGYQFRQYDTLLGHIKMAHTKQYQCPISDCGMRFSSGDLSREHSRSHKIDKSFQCPIDGCLKRFTTSALANLHKRYHGDPGTFICPMVYCDKVYSSSYNFNVHVQSHSDDVVPDGELACADCGQQCTTARNLAIHRTVHAGECPFEECGQVKLDHEHCSSFAKKMKNVRLQLIKPGPSDYLITATRTTQTTQTRRPRTPRPARSPPPPVDPAIVARILAKYNIPWKEG